MLLLDGRSTAYQWDSNLYLIIPGGKVGDDIHFGRNKTAAVVKAELKDGRIVAPVPNVDLQTDGEIDVYRYIYDPKGNRTIWADKLTVLPRERPDDYVYTETPVKTWNELDVRIKSLEETVATELPVKVAPPNWNQNNEAEPDYIKNRPGGYVNKIVDLHWDGNLDGHLIVELGDSMFVKISDKCPSKEDLLGATISFKQNNSNRTAILTNDKLTTFSDNCYGAEIFACVSSAPTTVGDATFPEIGTYFVNYSDISVQSVIKEDIVQIPSKYLDLSTCVLQSEFDNKLANFAYDGIILKSTTADSSKTFKLTVDDTGKLTAMEVTTS